MGGASPPLRGDAGRLEKTDGWAIGRAFGRASVALRAEVEGRMLVPVV